MEQKLGLDILNVVFRTVKKVNTKKQLLKYQKEIELTSSLIYNYACKKIKTGYAITKI